ncbi:MAG: LptF/LptG family permease, partial [Pseudomonadota bacterium]
LTGVVWVTQAQRRLDRVNVKGHTILLFFEMTVLALPSLIIVVTPFAVLFALVSTLSVLHSDSELVVINSTGGSRMVVLRPILTFVVIAGLLTALMTVYVSPLAKRHLRDLVTQVRADFIASVVVPGRFSSVEKGLTVHIRDRDSDGALIGLLLHDEREPETTTTILSKRGRIAEIADMTLLILADGSIQRRNTTDQKTSIVEFEQYAFDLSSLSETGEGDAWLKPSERTTGELMNLDTSEWYVKVRYGRFVAELHERFVQPLYPIALGLVVILFLGDPRTNRQGRSLAVAGAIIGCIAVRTGGFVANSIVLVNANAVPTMYVLPLAVIGGCLFIILSGRSLSAPKAASHLIDRSVAIASATAARFSGRRADAPAT